MKEQFADSPAMPKRASTRGRRKAWAWTGAALLCSMYVTNAASAIPAQAPSWSVINIDQPLVEDGALLLRFSQGDLIGSPTDLTLTVTGDANTEVPGTLELLDLAGGPYAVFHFNAALGLGKTLYATGASSTTTVYAGMFTTTDAFEGRLPSTTVTATPGVYLLPIDQACCLSTALISPIGPYAPACLVMRSAELPSVSVDLGLAPDDPVARQYLYRISLTAPQLEEGLWGPATLTGFRNALTSDTVADEYCYRAEAYRITDGDVIELAASCVPHSQGILGEVGPTEQAIMSALQVAACATPPSGFEEAWCEVNRQACADPMSPSQYACEQATFETVCAAYPGSGESLTDLVEAANGGSAGASGTDGRGDGDGNGDGAGAAGDSSAGMGGSGMAGANGEAGRDAQESAGASGGDGNTDSLQDGQDRSRLAGGTDNRGGGAGMSGGETLTLAMDDDAGGGNGGCSVANGPARGSVWFVVLTALATLSLAARKTLRRRARCR